jgi:serine/threonine protein kinase
MLEGQVIKDLYHLEALIGAGGFGGVFRASEVVRDRVLRQSAVKLLADTSNQQLNELMEATRLDHHNLIRCYTGGDCRLVNVDFLFLAMEMADYSLQTRLEQGNLSLTETKNLIRDVASALAYLHSQNKVHRDLKPANVLWVGDRWKLSDFGLVRTLGNASYAQTSNPIGTIAYMPPEAFADGHRISTAWDIWSLGIMIVAVTTGQLPYQYNAETQLLKRVMDCDVKIPKLPGELQDIVKGCLVRDRRQRWTAQDVLKAVTPTQPPIVQPAAQPRQAEDNLRLESEQGVDYRRLQQLLAAGNWKEADLETAHRMLEAVGREEDDWIVAEELKTFPCKDLRTIDRLWVHYSGGKFGFSVQKQIYVECGGKLDGNYPGDKIWDRFCDRVGWRVNNQYIYYFDINFNTSASQGHLPIPTKVWAGGGVGEGAGSLLSHIAL